MSSLPEVLNSPLYEIPLIALILLAAIVVAIWIGVHRFVRAQNRGLRCGLFAVGVLIGFVAWCVLTPAILRIGAYLLAPFFPASDAAQMVVTTYWPLWILCLLGAVATEIIIWLYALERQAVSRAKGLTLLGLRLFALVLAAILLMQVSFYSIWNRVSQRYIAVLIDDSASMHLPDASLTATEKLRLGRLFDIEIVANPFDFPAAAHDFRDIEKDLAAQLARLESARGGTPDILDRQIDRSRPDLAELLEDAAAASADASKMIVAAEANQAWSGKTLAPHLAKAKDQLQQFATEVVPAAIDTLAASQTSGGSADFDQLLKQVHAVRDSLEDIPASLTSLVSGMDEAYLGSLSADRRSQLEDVCESTRSAVVNRVLLNADADQKNLLARIGENHVLKLYHFASSAEQAQAEDLESAAGDVIGAEQQAADSGTPGSKSDDPSDSPTAQRPAAEKQKLAAMRAATNLAAALAKVKEDVLADQLSGIVVFTDGRHNVTDADWAAAARDLASKESPIHSVIIGGEQPPKDIAVAAVKRPQTVFSGDNVAFSAEVKADGYRGRELAVRLVHDDTEVDRKTINVASDRMREQVRLSHKPEGAGLHVYHLEVVDEKAADGDSDLITANDRSKEQIAVTDDRTKLLIIDDRPRWEYRYLKNLFTGRDKSVMLQHVLLHPDRIADVPPPPVVHASAGRPFGEFEANALPENKAEWMKFDCIVLGDVPPSALNKETIDILADFVEKRGGSLIVIAGTFYMPHAFADTRLANILPVEIEKLPGAALHGPEPIYQLALTGDGRSHVITSLGSDPEQTEQVWDSMPRLFWRHPGVVAKPSATVLSYAKPLTNDELSATEELSEEERRQTERARALIVFDQVGAGRVLMLNIDRMWRRRLFVGNKYHYRFWAQALRWATVDRLPAGTTLVRLGTDRTEYGAGDPIVVKARLIDEKGDGVQSDQVTAEIYLGNRLITAKQMDYIPDSLGRYEALLGNMPAAGLFRVELSGGPVKTLLAGTDMTAVSTDIVVSDAAHTNELFELAANNEIPLSLASLSQRGIAGAVVYPDEAESLLERFGPPTRPYTEAQAFTLWDSLPLMLLCVVVLSSEWIIRKKVGLI